MQNRTDDDGHAAEGAAAEGAAAEGAAWWSRFEHLLDDQTEWPAPYTFKFIAPREGLDALKALFDDHPVTVRASSKGNYVSVTAHLEMESSEDVIAIYDAAAEIDGIIAL